MMTQMKMNKSKTKKKVKKYWYFQHTTECVLCGYQDIYRERRYGRKPKASERYGYKQEACDYHFI
jgi:hypothetical protein